MTPMLEAQNISGLQKEQPLLLLEENLEQLSIGNEEEYGWEDELEELSRRLQEPVNLNAATKRQLEQFPFLTDIQIENLLAYVYIHGQIEGGSDGDLLFFQPSLQASVEQVCKVQSSWK